MLRRIARHSKHAVKRLLGLPTLEGDKVRRFLAQVHIRGEGLEVGALHHPLWLPHGARVRYVDRMTVEGLREHYPELNDKPLTRVDIVDDGETLSTLSKGSQDFIVGNHFLEHCQDPIGTIRRYLDLVRKGGTLYLAVPDKRWTFDKDRPLTTLEHLYRDHEEGPEQSKRDHFVEFVRYVRGVEGAELEAQTEDLLGRDYSIHFHVWDQWTYLEFLLAIRDRYALPFDLAAFVTNRQYNEHISILKRTAS